MQISTGTGYAAGATAAHAQGDLLLQQAQGNSDSKDKNKIEKAGKDFESILLGSWLQGAEQSFAAAPGGDSDEDDSSREQFMGMAMQQLAGTLVNSGGIGIAKMITEHLEAAGNARPNSGQK
jgi:Rod binding domain-containing protein